ncbi:hypothetical protein G6F46_006843 [Rhizopus delemar]|uniref:GCF C-terminal domain-containing protein n=3 Tax=Rhizopus TaxID=4842 RepID=I1BYL2_RHIO9|nr:hypothetical protein RO3G_05997 [Rhizopus delemar RA 99-880]KAG1458165.1 hypothetical protein G6F55_005501 [Rhizopus delemar]KAG1542990.1 hypothetical protein G6F51_006946 [Rhizopus arrhizus]KAG1505022.1 hypothetical protein G6F54_000594 [Rhizopus delemar]KAG1510638.1 hypothetical protein G6F53_006534 [Rhizopus delemar]|eukprot:EIE81292.1 hypothetical protein RO3G_05997 [Rhizopus delemar RA 99-880]
MFKKPSRAKNIRRKIEVTDDEPTSTEEEVIIKKTITSLAEKKKKKEAKKAIPALSFDQEENEEEFQIKKPNKGRKLQIREDLIQLNDQPERATSSYDAETLNKLRAATPSIRSVSSGDALLHEKFPSVVNPTIQTTGIPDASAILAAKKKREQMRKGFTITEQDDGFIPLDDNNETEDTSGSRLVREEDDIADDGEAELDKYVGGSFTINQGKAKFIEKERREGVREMIEEAEQEDEQSEDMGRWEEDMIKYGGARTQRKENDPFAIPTNYKQAQVPESSVLPTLADVMSSLSLATNDLTFSTTQHEQNLAETQRSMDTLKRTKEDVEREIERGGGRYNYFQDLAQYVNDLGEFLDAKFPELEKLEEQVHDLVSSETEIILSRHWQDNVDDLLLFADIQQLDEEMEEENVDEFGRVKELRNSDAARRRRKEERQQRMSRQADLAEESVEDLIKEQGLWTDDEMQDDEQRDNKLQAIETAGIDALMEDVSEEFRSLGAVKEKFEAWKTTYYEDYQKAFGSLSLPGAFEFYIRLELITWNPFLDPAEFDSMEWHKILSEYGLSSEHEDPDTEMLNKVVEKSMIKKIKSLLDTLNVRSSRQMRYASQVMEQVSYYIDPSEKAYKELANEFVDVFQRQMSRIVEMIEKSSLKSNLDKEGTEAKKRFFWSQCKYLKTLALLRRQLPKDQLRSLSHTITTKILAPILIQNNELDIQLQNEIQSMLSILQK